MHVGKNNPRIQYHFVTKDGNKTICTGEEEKDLGITFDSNLKFDIHINAIVGRANKIVGLISADHTITTILMVLNYWPGLTLCRIAILFFIPYNSKRPEDLDHQADGQ